MARSFNVGSLAVDLPAETAAITIAYSFKHSSAPTNNNATGRQAALYKANTDFTQANYYLLHGSSLLTLGNTSAPSTYWEGTANWTADTSAHSIVWSLNWGGSAFEVYLDGVALSATRSNYSSPQTPVNKMRIAGQFTAASDGANVAQAFLGVLENVGLWSGVALTAAEALAFHRHRNPTLIRPASLARYWPILGNSTTEPELVVGTTATLTGTANRADGLRFTPRRQRIWRPAELGVSLIIADAAHAHAADNLALTQLHVLTVAEAAHAHAADNLALTQDHILSVAEALHDHAADNLTLTTTAPVQFDAASESHTGTTGSTSQASFSWTHTPTGTPKGVLVFTFNNANSDIATGVTYGGVSMSAVSGGRAVDTANETGDCKAWFLGASIPTGAQTVTVSRTNNATVMYAVAITVTASSDTAVYTTGIVLLQNDGTLAEQSVDDGTPANPSIRFAGINSGLPDVPAAGANSTATSMLSIDFGARTIGTVRESTPGTGARSVGFSSGTSDDRAAVHLAVYPTGSSNSDLVLQDAAHAHAADNLVLTQLHVLTVAEAAHAHAADNLVLTQLHVLTVAEALHAHAADNLTLTVSTELAVAEALHAHGADNLALTQLHVLTVAEATHAHAADNIVLTQDHMLALAEALHAHAADNVTLSGEGALAIAEALHAHIADGVTLTQQHVLAVAEALHAHAAEQCDVSGQSALTIADSTHAHAADNLALTQLHLLTIAEGVHAHMADNLGLTQAHVLAILEALHAHSADNVIFSSGLKPPELYRIGAELRFLAVHAETRLLRVPR